METASVWPPTARDRIGLVQAYAGVLSWRLVLGDGQPASADDVMSVWQHDPHVPLQTPCQTFDLLRVPLGVGPMLLLMIDRQLRRPVPCLRSNDALMFLVRQGTAVLAAAEEPQTLKAASGPEVLLVLPPTSGVRWDTPPWLPSVAQPVELPDARELLVPLRETLPFFRPD